MQHLMSQIALICFLPQNVSEMRRVENSLNRWLRNRSGTVRTSGGKEQGEAEKNEDILNVTGVHRVSHWPMAEPCSGGGGICFSSGVITTATSNKEGSLDADGWTEVILYPHRLLSLNLYPMRILPFGGCRSQRNSKIIQE